MNQGPDFFLNVLCLAIYSDDTATSKMLKAVIEIFDEEGASNSAFQDELTKFYMSLIKDIIHGEVDLTSKGEVAAILLKVKQHPMAKEDESVLQDLKEVFANRKDVSSRRVTNLKTTVRNWALLYKNSKTMRTMFAKKQKCSQTTDSNTQGQLLKEVLGHAKEIVDSYDTDSEEEVNIDFINLSDKASVSRGMENWKEKRVSKTWKTGLQGLNRLFGPDHEGPVPGEFVGFAALSYHYKSGMLMNFARWIATQNTPGKMNNKVPAIVFISLENEVFENQMAWFRAAYANAYGESGDGLSNEEIIDYVTTEFSKKGFQVLVFRRMGELYGYEEYVKEIESLEHQGYRVLATMVDYLTLMNLGEGGANDAKKLQNLCTKIKNYGSHKNMLTLTGFQLGTEAQILADSKTMNVAKKFGPAHMADCKGIKRELDVLIFLHIEENHQGIPFVTMKIDKHKYCRMPKNTYTAYRLHETLGVLDDIHGESKEVLDIYSVGLNDETSDSTESSLF